MTQLKDKEIIKLRWKLDCGLSKAVSLINESGDGLLRPWFVTKTNFKSLILDDKNFLLWPNTIAGSLYGCLAYGKLVENENYTYIQATIRMFPLLSIFKSNTLFNLLIGSVMVISWMLTVYGVVFEKPIFDTIFPPVFVISGVFILIQFVKFIHSPEINELERHIRRIFAELIIEESC